MPTLLSHADLDDTVGLAEATSLTPLTSEGVIRKGSSSQKKATRSTRRGPFVDDEDEDVLATGRDGMVRLEEFNTVEPGAACAAR